MPEDKSDPDRIEAGRNACAAREAAIDARLERIARTLEATAEMQSARERRMAEREAMIAEIMTGTDALLRKAQANE